MQNVTSRGRRRLAIPVALMLLAAAVPTVAARTAPARGRPTPAATGTPDPLAQQLQDANRRRAAIDATKKKLTGEVQAAQDQQQSLGSLVAANRRAIADTIKQIAASEQAFHDATVRERDARARQAAFERQAVADRALLSAFARTRYVHSESFVEYLLGSDSFNDLLSRTAILFHLTDRGTELVRQVREDLADAAAAASLAAADAAAARQAAADLAKQEQQLRAQVAREQALIASLGSGITAANVEIAAADAQDAALAQAIADLRIQEIDRAILAAEQAAWDEGEYYYQHHILVGAAPPPAPGQARFIWPVPGSEITQYWGPCGYPFEPPYFGYPHFHTGVDLAAPMGHPVYAAADGVVVAASRSDEGYGNHVIIAHDSHTFTLYGHLESFAVHPGDQVRQGQVIGLLGSSGNSTGPHTHFEVRVDRNPTDPGPYLPPLPDGAKGPPAQ
jgi:murein DD-endopeptidase MepM/ murein hydrolase activator NlpD